MELKEITKGILVALPIITTSFYFSTACADEKDNSHDHDPQNSDEIDPSSVTLKAMLISSGQAPEAFESIKLIKKYLGIATDGADVLKQTPGLSVTR